MTMRCNIYAIVDGNNPTADELLISCVGVNLFGVGEMDLDVGGDLYPAPSVTGLINKLALGLLYN